MNTKTVIFDLRSLPDASLTAARVAGIPALDRTMLALQRVDDGGGDGRAEPLYTRAVLLAHPDEREKLQERVGRTPRITMEQTWLADEGRGLGAVLKADALVGATEVLYWPADVTFGRFIPQLARESAPANGARALCRGSSFSDEGPALLSLTALERHEDLGLAELLDALDDEGTLERTELDHPAMRIREPADRKRAEDALMVSLRKPVDGVVANYNRYISLAISRLLLKLPIHPNVITVLAGVAGVVCGLIAAQGTYWALLGASSLFQLSSILDGTDGEISRAKLLESRTGQWLDTISDDISNVAFFTGAAVGCWRFYDSSLCLVLGGVATVGFLIAIGLQYHYLLEKVGCGDLNKFKMPWEEEDSEARAAEEHVKPAAFSSARPQTPGARILESIRFLVRRDTFVFLCVVFSIPGELRVMLGFIALGTVVTSLSILFYRYIVPLFRRYDERTAHNTK